MEFSEWKWYWKYFATVAGLTVSAQIIFWIAGWGWIFSIFTFTNVSKKWETAYQRYEDLEEAVQAVCLAQESLDAAPEADKSQRQTYLMTYKLQYNSIAADYNAAIRNPLDTGFVLPSDLPKEAPTLNVMQKEQCPE